MQISDQIDRAFVVDKNPPAGSRGTTERTAIELTETWLAFDFVCEPAVNPLQRSAVIWPDPRPLVVVRLTKPAESDPAPVATRVIEPANGRLLGASSSPDEPAVGARATVTVISTTANTSVR